MIFARVAPEQKFRVVSRLKAMGEVVAVTGDGVNDAPALKKADIGVAMGITGTDVAKEAADIILTDDNFASIVRAIEEGRGVYGNIRKFLTYILTSNMSEGAPSAAFLLSRGGIPLPLTVMQILAIDLGTDMVPALGLGTERPEPGVMDRPPRAPTERLMNRSVLIKAFVWYGLLETIFSMSAYFYVNVQERLASGAAGGLRAGLRAGDDNDAGSDRVLPDRRSSELPHRPAVPVQGRTVLQSAGAGWHSGRDFTA